MYFEPTIAEMTFTTEGEDGRRVIHSDFLLLCIVADTHADVIVACSAKRMSMIQKDHQRYLPPNIEWQLKARYKNALIYFPGPIPQGMFAWNRVSDAGVDELP